jgi:hypothetical protein
LFFSLDKTHLFSTIPLCFASARQARSLRFSSVETTHIARHDIDTFAGFRLIAQGTETTGTTGTTIFDQL